jgi:hypothetical protein
MIYSSVLVNFLNIIKYYATIIHQSGAVCNKMVQIVTQNVKFLQIFMQFGAKWCKMVSQKMMIDLLLKSRAIKETLVRVRKEASD